MLGTLLGLVKVFPECSMFNFFKASLLVYYALIVGANIMVDIARLRAVNVQKRIGKRPKIWDSGSCFLISGALVVFCRTVF